MQRNTREILQRKVLSDLPANRMINHFPDTHTSVPVVRILSIISNAYMKQQRAFRLREPRDLHYMHEFEIFFRRSIFRGNAIMVI